MKNKKILSEIEKLSYKVDKLLTHFKINKIRTKQIRPIMSLNHRKISKKRFKKPNFQNGKHFKVINNYQNHMNKKRKWIITSNGNKNARKK